MHIKQNIPFINVTIFPRACRNIKQKTIVKTIHELNLVQKYTQCIITKFKHFDIDSYTFCHQQESIPVNVYLTYHLMNSHLHQPLIFQVQS